MNEVPTPSIREWYNSLLESAIRTDTFYERIAVLLHQAPYFFPAHLEMIWKAEEDGDKEQYTKNLLHAHDAITRLLKDSALRAYAAEEWSEVEKRALLDVLELVEKNKDIRFERRLFAKVQRLTAGERVRIKTRLSPIEPNHLKKVATVDLPPLQKELQAVAPFWWQFSLKRSTELSYHQFTRAIVLRRLDDMTEAYTPYDGVHESIATSKVTALPHLHETVLGLAEKLNIGLGRVAVVRLNPYARVYRHYDAEIYLRGRDRYHFVLEAGKENMLYSGIESADARPGEVWFFDNKAMHRAYNNSSSYRTHVIFDGYPLDSKRV